MSAEFDALVEKAARAICADRNRTSSIRRVWREYREDARIALLAIGLPALLERVEAADVLAVVRQRDEWYRKFAEVSVERDALAAKVADAGERIALAIEAEAATFRPSTYRQALERAAAIARIALTEGTDGA